MSVIAAPMHSGKQPLMWMIDKIWSQPCNLMNAMQKPIAKPNQLNLTDVDNDEHLIIIVAKQFAAVNVVEKPITVNDTNANVTPQHTNNVPAVDNGGYNVQPKPVIMSIKCASINNNIADAQIMYDALFNFAKPTSGEQINNGTKMLPYKPNNTGIAKPKIIIKPCNVTYTLYESYDIINLIPGDANSNLMINDEIVAHVKPAKPNMPQNIPTNLWLTVDTNTFIADNIMSAMIHKNAVNAADVANAQNIVQSWPDAQFAAQIDNAIPNAVNTNVITIEPAPNILQLQHNTTEQLIAMYVANTNENINVSVVNIITIPKKFNALLYNAAIIKISAMFSDAMFLNAIAVNDAITALKPNAPHVIVLQIANNAAATNVVALMFTIP